MENAQTEGVSQIDADIINAIDPVRSSPKLARPSWAIGKANRTLDRFDRQERIVAGARRSTSAKLVRLTDIDRFHEVAVCLTEAVAVLGTQLEREGSFPATAIAAG